MLRTTWTFFVLILFLVNHSPLDAQSDPQSEGSGWRYCGTDLVHQRLMENSSSETVQRIQAAEEELREQREAYEGSGQRATLRTIPVVFHVIHNDGPENVSKQRIENALDILNRDFRKENADTTDIVPAFQNIAADVEVEFRLAQRDPSGDCHLGITRTQSTRTYDGDQQMKSLIQWDPSSYLNIWICNNIDFGGGGGVAGYTIQPADAQNFPNMDGIVLKYDYLGDQSPSSPQKGRTLTHEVGHYLNLNHVWGSGQVGSSCGDDGLSDTPQTTGWFNCNNNNPGSASSCGSQDNIQNYMDYSYCHRMFTQDQKNAMRSALNSAIGDRNDLWTSSNLQATGVSGLDILCEAEFSVDQRIICQGQSVQFTDNSYHNPSSWNWQFQGGNANATNTQNPTVTYPDTGSFDVTLTVGNGGSNVTKTRQSLIKVLPSPGSELPWVDPLDWMDSLEAHPKYFVENPANDQVEWEYTDETGEGGSNGCIKLENHSNSGGEMDALLTNTMDASQIPSGNLELGFDVAYTKISSSDNDELVVYASQDCGQTWSQRGTFSGNSLQTAPPTGDPFTPSSGEWERKTINNSLVSTYNVENLRFKFEFTSDGGNNIYIDNINVYDENKVGIQEQEEESISARLTPNPVNAKTYLQLELHERETVEMELYDISGNKVRTVQPKKEFAAGEHRNELDVSELSAGAYFLKLRVGERILTKKLFKQ